MKSFDRAGASQPEEAHSPASYFSHGLLSKIIHSDQSLARPTEQVLRRRWVNRMILAEAGFVLGVVLLQFFPVIEDSSAATAEPTPAATAITVTTTPEPSPIATESALVIAPIATVEPATPTLVPSQPAAVVPVALPDTGGAALIDMSLYTTPILCVGGGLMFWLLASARSNQAERAASTVLDEPQSDDEGLFR